MLIIYNLRVRRIVLCYGRGGETKRVWTQHEESYVLCYAVESALRPCWWSHSFIHQELCWVNISHFSSPATLSRSLFEMSVLTLQAARVILESDCATLCWDSTSFKHQHINEVHVQTDLQTFTLSICVNPGEYVAHISSVVDKMASVYSDYTGEPREDVSTKI